MNGGYISSSDDDVPLKVASNDDDNDDDTPLRDAKPPGYPQSYQNLCQQMHVDCNFCDRTFDNRLTAIKHNMKHIIIPLIRQSLIQCPTCLYYFLTWKSFNEHNLDKHEQKKNKNRLQNLIRFEEDVEMDALNCELESIKAVSIDASAALKLDKPAPLKIDELIVLSSDDETEKITPYDSVNSYDRLVEEGSHKCLYCNRVFLTKYMLFTHNLRHIKVHSEMHFCKFCEIYFETKYELKNHLATEHPGKVMDTILRRCRECNLIYNSWVKHHSKYHSLYICSSCKNNKFFKNEKDYRSHMKVHEFQEDFVECDKCGETILVKDVENHEAQEHKPILICQICTIFVQSNNLVTYVKIGSHLGEERIPCEKCSNLFLNLNIMQKVKTSRPYKTKPKCKTNTDRLKSIHNRLKRLKELNKY